MTNKNWEWTLYSNVILRLIINFCTHSEKTPSHLLSQPIDRQTVRLSSPPSVIPSLKCAHSTRLVSRIPVLRVLQGWWVLSWSPYVVLICFACFKSAGLAPGPLNLTVRPRQCQEVSFLIKTKQQQTDKPPAALWSFCVSGVFWRLPGVLLGTDKVLSITHPGTLFHHAHQNPLQVRHGGAHL